MSASVFVFEDYSFDGTTAYFNYSDGNGHVYQETVTFSEHGDYDSEVFERLLRLCFFLIGTSYFKSFPTSNVRFSKLKLSPLDAELLGTVYRDGLSQFVFENQLDPADLPIFHPTTDALTPCSYKGKGVLALQSGGKDSLLLAQLLDEQQIDFTPWYMTQTSTHPAILNSLPGRPLRTVRRVLDLPGITAGLERGGLNGHVPVTYITMALAVADAVLHNENTVLVAIGREGAEPHAFVGDLAINHQWSKTWEAEQLLAHYVAGQISPDLVIGSPLRPYSELRVAELFVEKAWRAFGHSFSSCNRANYQQGADNTQLRWCGDCPKCANSFLLFAPFVLPSELERLFGGRTLLTSPHLADTFKGLLGIDGVMKPFECVGEVDELRQAYHMAQERYGGEGYALPFVVPASNFNYRALGPAQQWAKQLISV